MYTRSFNAYEIYNHEFGTITIFEDYDNVLRWIEDNKSDTNGYKNYGLKLLVSSQTDLWYEEG